MTEPAGPEELLSPEISQTILELGRDLAKARAERDHAVADARQWQRAAEERNGLARKVADLRDEVATARQETEDVRERYGLVVSDRDELSIKLEDVTIALQGDADFKPVLVNPAVDQIQALCAERDQLQARIAEQEQVLEIVRAQTDDCITQVDAALGHRYHTTGIHYSIPHVAEKAAAEIEQLQARIDAALTIVAAWWEAKSEVEVGHALDGVRAALQPDAPTEPAPGLELDVDAPSPLAPYKDLLASIWLYVKWRYVTKQLTTEQKNLWADAVEEISERDHPGEGADADRWWQGDQPAEPEVPGA